MAIGVKIGGPEGIQAVGAEPAPVPRYPIADAADFGGASAQAEGQMGAAIAAIGDHLTERRRVATDQVAHDTASLDYATQAQKATLDLQNQYPAGGQGFTDALKQKLDDLKPQVLDGLSQKGLSISPVGQDALNSHFTQVQQQYLLHGVEFENNAQVGNLKNTLGQNADAVGADVYSSGDIDSGLKRLDQTVASGRGLMHADELDAFRNTARKNLVDQALRGFKDRAAAASDAGDTDAANKFLQQGEALSRKYFGDATNPQQQSGTGATPGPQSSLEPPKIVDDTGKFGVGYAWGKMESGQVKGLIIHHTGGEGDTDGVISTLQERHLGAQYVIDRDGAVHQLLPDGAAGRQIKNGWGQGEGLNNQNTIGVEVIAKDDKDVLPAQVQAAQKLAGQLGQKYGFDPTTSTFGHGQVNPGHKEADEGLTITRAIRGGTGNSVASNNPPVNDDTSVPAAIRYNNPGAMWPRKEAAQFGAYDERTIGGGNKIAVFPSPVNGAAANMAHLANEYVGTTIGDAQKRWSGQNRSSLPGWDSGAVITKDMVNDPSFMVPFMKSMADAEAPHGSQALNDQQWQQSFQMYKSGGGKQYAKADTGITSDAGPQTASPDGTVQVAANDTPQQGVSVGGALIPDAKRASEWQQQFETARKATTVDQERQIRLKAQQAKQLSDKAEDETFQKIVGKDPSVTATSIAADPRLTPERKEHMVDLLTKATKDKDSNTYGAGFYDLFKQVHADPNDPKRITDPSQLYSHVGDDGDLTMAGLDKLRTELAGKKTPDGEAEGAMKKQLFKYAESQLSGKNPAMPMMKDPKGDEIMLKWMGQFYSDYEKGKANGKTASQLLTPDSSDYIGKSVTAFKRSPAQINADLFAANTGVAATSGKDVDTSTAPGLIQAVQSGKLSRAEGEAIALKNGWIRANPPPPVAAPATPAVPMSR